MKFKKTISLLTAALMLSTVALAGCGGNKEQTKQTTETKKPEVDNTQAEAEGLQGQDNGKPLAAKQELNIVGEKLLTLDSSMTTFTPDMTGQAPCVSSLMVIRGKADGTTELVPELAESYEASEDGLVYTFHLRPDLKWSDGTALTAQDFVYTWQRIFDPAVAAPYSWMVQSVIKNGNDVLAGKKELKELGVAAPDDQTVEFTLAEANPDMLTFAAFPAYAPVQQAAIEKFGTSYGSSVDEAVFSGPFVMTTWDDTKLVYEPNPNYWNKENVFLTKITSTIMSEKNTVGEALQKNELDMAGMNDPNWNSILDETGIYNVVTRPDTGNWFQNLNCKDDILQNQKIRLALSLAYPREECIEALDNGNGYPLYSIVPPTIDCMGLNYSKTVNGENEYIKELQKTYPDPKALLIEGMEELNLGSDPSTITIEYTTRGLTEYSKKQGEFLQQMYQESLGINIEINMQDYNITDENMVSGDYQMATGGWGADYDSISNFLDTWVVGKELSGHSHWEGEDAEKYTELVNTAKVIEDPQKRAEAYLEAEKVLLESGCVIPTTCSLKRTLIGKYVEGYYSCPFVFQDFAGVKIHEK